MLIFVSEKIGHCFWRRVYLGAISQGVIKIPKACGDLRLHPHVSGASELKEKAGIKSDVVNRNISLIKDSDRKQFKGWKRLNIYSVTNINTLSRHSQVSN